MGGWWSARRQVRHERRRRGKLEVAQRRGDRSARAMWLLPRYVGPPYGATAYLYESPDRVVGPDEVKVEVRQDVTTSTRIYRFNWRASFLFGQLCQPRLSATPPVSEATVDQLCPLYVPVKSTWVSGIPYALVETEGYARRVAGDRADIDRWRDATNTYISGLRSTQREVIDYWVRRGQKLPLSRLRRRSFRRWQALVEAADQRLLAASDRYRPVLDEVTEMIKQTEAAYEALAEHYSSLREWEDRKIWRLEPRGDGFLIARTDVAKDDTGQATPGKPIRDVYKTASDKRHHDLRPVDWDEEAIAASDTELNDLFSAHREIGRTRSGETLVYGPPLSFTDWFDRHVGYKYQSISDRDQLAEDIQRRARVVAEMDKRRTRREGGGSWPTDYTDSGGGDGGGGGGF